MVPGLRNTRLGLKARSNENPFCRPCNSLLFVPPCPPFHRTYKRDFGPRSRRTHPPSVLPPATSPMSGCPSPMSETSVHYYLTANPLYRHKSTCVRLKFIRILSHSSFSPLAPGAVWPDGGDLGLQWLTIVTKYLTSRYGVSCL